jgi:hypothetical protein
MPETALPPYFQIAARKYFVRHQVPVPVRMPLLCQRRIYSIQIVKALNCELCKKVTLNTIRASETS